jgi:hypothetical protein
LPRRLETRTIDGQMVGASEKRIRVLVLGLSQLVEAMVATAFEDADEVEIVTSRSPGELTDAIRETRADFVVVPLHGTDLPPGAQRFLDAQAHVRLLGVEETEGRAYLYELLPETTEIEDAAPVDLLAAIRVAATGGQT